MFENKIKFLCLKEYLEFADHKPEPVSLNLPEWYKKLEHTFKNMTVKGCLPFMDTLTTGYLMRASQDFYVDLQHNPEAKNKVEMNLYAQNKPMSRQDRVFKKLFNNN